MSLARASRVTLFLLLVCVVLDIVVLRKFIVRTELEHGQLGRGYFEEVDGQMTLVVNDHVDERDVLREITRNRAGDSNVPPGTTAMLPLDPGREVVISAQTSLAPYCVLGATTPTKDATMHRRSPCSGAGGSRRRRRADLRRMGRVAPLDRGRGMAPRSDGEVRAGWSAPPLAVSRTGGSVEVRLGRCAGRFEVPSGECSRLWPWSRGPTGMS